VAERGLLGTVIKQFAALGSRAVDEALAADEVEEEVGFPTATEVNEDFVCTLDLENWKPVGTVLPQHSAANDTTPRAACKLRRILGEIQYPV
jgi:hypothetical protein